MKNDPTAVGGEVVCYAALEFFTLEEWSCGVGELVEVLCDFGALGVGDRVYADFHTIDELEEGLQQGPGHQPHSDLFTHLILIIIRTQIIFSSSFPSWKPPPFRA
jgi:hypothetical protein